VEQDEAEVEIISSTLADQQIGKGVRRSTRLQQSIEMAVDQQIAAPVPVPVPVACDIDSV